jgi:hypothetical protein
VPGRIGGRGGLLQRSKPRLFLEVGIYPPRGAERNAVFPHFALLVSFHMLIIVDVESALVCSIRITACRWNQVRHGDCFIHRIRQPGRRVDVRAVKFDIERS